MTKQTASLHWRCAIANATNYIKYLDITDDGERERVEMFYGVVNGELEKWARERINNILAVAADLWSQFADCDEISTVALTVTAGSRRSLRQVGFGGYVPTADTMKIE
jgi:hypothetical protein